MPALSKMAFGNKLGFEISADVKEDDLFAPAYGCIVAEVPADKLSEITTAYTKVGTVKDVVSYIQRKFPPRRRSIKRMG